MNKSVIQFPIPPPNPHIYGTTDESYLRLEFENKQLREDIAIERKYRYDAEQKVQELENKILEFESKQKKTNKKLETPKTYSEFKSNGVRKARPAESIRSYEDFVSFQNFFLDRGQIRNWAMWTSGICFGLRISDLFSLNIFNVLNENKQFRKRIFIKEHKTSKANNCLITEAIIMALTKYFDSLNWNFEMSDFLFASKKTGGKMYEEYGWKILSDAGKALGLPYVVGSHTMRKSFANIAACVDKSNIDMNTITKIQGLLNHSDQTVTMRYLGTYQDMYDKARISVSDFVLGKTDVHELIAGNNNDLDDIISKLDVLDAKLTQLREIKV